MTLPVMAQTVKQGPEGKNVEDLIKAKAVDDYAEFVKKTNPLLTATNGAEIRSFLQLKAEGGWRASTARSARSATSTTSARTRSRR